MTLHSLRTRFVFLLAAFGVLVVINAGTTLWGVLFLERQIYRPMRATETALRLLGTARRAVGEQRDEIARGSRAAAIGADDLVAREQGHTEIDVGALLEHSDTAGHAAQDLMEAEHLEIVLGGGVPLYLAELLAQAERRVRAWVDSGSVADRAAALDMLSDIHERIEATEAQVVESASMASAQGLGLRWLVLASFGASVVIAVLAGLLAVQLVRRWVLQPVAKLREAAERFGRGEFEYRVRVAGQGEIAMLASEFNAMATTIGTMQAERIERERMAAFGSATRRIVHNIKSPLAGIRMMAELAGDEPSDAARQEKLVRILATTDRLNTWLKRLLDLSRPGEINRTSMDVRRWLEEVLAPLKTRAHGAGVALEVGVEDGPERASFDAVQLEQAVVALVSNALEATPSGGTVWVRAWREESANRPARWGLDVTDSGAGVDADAVDRLFQPYFTTKAEGSGIGLAMVQKVARDHGGEAWLRDAGAGRGAVFSLWLPLA